MKCPFCQSQYFNICEEYITVDTLMIDDNGELVADQMIDNEHRSYYTNCCGTRLCYDDVIKFLKQKQGIE